jgi:predicted lipoprotein
MCWLIIRVAHGFGEVPTTLNSQKKASRTWGLATHFSGEVVTTSSRAKTVPEDG